jgi:hypothetical protein
MNRREFCRNGVIAAMSSGSGKALAFGQGGSQPAAADMESYAIWSALIPVLAPPAAKGYLVPELTALPEMIKGVTSEQPETPIEGRKLFFAGVMQVQVPPEWKARFDDAAESFRLGLKQRVRLERKLTLPHDYRLMDADALAEYGRIAPPLCVADPGHPWHRDRALERKYARFAPPLRFSRVSYDGGKTLGLVWAATATGGDTIYAFGRENAAWQKMPWRASTWSFNC